MTMKRIREVGEEEEGGITSMANYLMSLSGGGATVSLMSSQGDEDYRVFRCKTCEREFPSFQALGGHRASHKKPRLASRSTDHCQPQPISPPKPKMHECPVCGLEFPIGQALGGHMRRHRPPPAPFTPDPHRKIIEVNNNNNNKQIRRKVILCVDLNLTPLENKFALAKVVPPVVDCFF